MTAINKQALIAKIKKQNESFDTVVLKEDEANLLLDELESAEKRIAELETRAVTVKLPADYRNDDGSINADMFNTCAVVSAFREALAAAGIGVKGE